MSLPQWRSFERPGLRQWMQNAKYNQSIVNSKGQQWIWALNGCAVTREWDQWQRKRVRRPALPAGQIAAAAAELLTGRSGRSCTAVAVPHSGGSVVTTVRSTAVTATWIIFYWHFFWSQVPTCWSGSMKSLLFCFSSTHLYFWIRSRSCLLC